MYQGHNRYPINKLASYKMISNFVPEKKQPSNKNRNRNRERNHNTATTNISFYQRRTPVEWPLVPGTNGTVESMIDCWNCERKCPIFPLYSEATCFQGMQLTFSQKRLDISHVTQFVKFTLLLIVTGSTFNSVYNDTLLIGIKACIGMKLMYNGSSMD